jgi:hypothetical protein
MSREDWPIAGKFSRPLIGSTHFHIKQKGGDEKNEMSNAKAQMSNQVQS